VLSTLASGLTISKASLYNPFGGDIHDFVRSLDEFGPRKLVQDVDAFDVVVGLRGELPRSLPAAGGWRWELSYDYGHTRGSEQIAGGIVLSRLAAALGPSFRDPTGDHCGTSPTTAVAGCVPINLLQLDHVTQQAVEDVAPLGSASGANTQHTALATLHGRVLELPDHGEVSAALGADVRAQSGRFTPDAQIASGDTTLPVPPPTSGSFHVLEGFGEISVVPVTGRPLADRIEIDLAARGFQDSASGTGAVWSAGGLYRPVAGVALRGTYATGFHEPSLTELFHGSPSTTVALEDPCDIHPPSKPTPTPLDPMVAAQCAQQMVPSNSTFGTSQLRTIAPGNPALATETATTRTAGIVLDPPWIPGLSLSLDYWSIELDSVSQGVSARDIESRCYLDGDASACARVHRDPAQGYRIAFIDLANLSTGTASTSGSTSACSITGRCPASGGSTSNSTSSTCSIPAPRRTAPRSTSAPARATWRAGRPCGRTGPGSAPRSTSATSAASRSARRDRAPPARRRAMPPPGTRSTSRPATRSTRRSDGSTWPPAFTTCSTAIRRSCTSADRAIRSDRPTTSPAG